jgi:hypothetical protein
MIGGAAVLGGALLVGVLKGLRDFWSACREPRGFDWNDPSNLQG